VQGAEHEQREDGRERQAAGRGLTGTPTWCGGAAVERQRRPASATGSVADSSSYGAGMKVSFH
jgi:hypothetical protein